MSKNVQQIEQPRKSLTKMVVLDGPMKKQVEEMLADPKIRNI